MSALDALVWPAARLGEALAALGRTGGLDPSGEPPAPPADLATRGAEATERWVDAAAAASGIEAEPVEVPYGEVEALLRRAAPALLALPSSAGGAPRLLALAGSGRRGLLVLGPDRRVRRIPLASVRDALAAPFDARIAPEVDRVLDEAEVPQRRRGRARAAILSERLAAARVPAGWLLTLPPGVRLWRQARWAQLPRWAGYMVGAHAVQHALLLASWWMLGRGVLGGRLDAGLLAAWALLLLSIAPFRTLEIWSSGVLTTRAGALLKRRLMAGVLRLEPEEIRHQGVGQLLGRVLSSEAVEVLILTGGHQGLIALTELVLAVPVLVLGAGGWPHALLLVGWTALAVAIAWRYLERRRAWTAARLGLTHDLVEKMVGHRTRLAQGDPARRHEEEDRDLERYVGLAAAMDRRAALLRVAIPRGWILASLAAVAPGFVGGGASAARLAVALGGTLFAFRAFWKLVRGLAELGEAAISWQQAEGLFRAAARPRRAVPPDLAAAGADSAAQAAPPIATDEIGDGTPEQAAARRADPESAVVLEAHGLGFRYGERAEPAIQGCDLVIRRGDRLLLEGPSGGGKSTLASLLVGLREPQSGLLLLDGLDRHTLGEEGWRRRAVEAPQFQENHVLVDTFGFNLLMGRGWPPRPGDMEEAEEICRELGLGDLLARMPAGLLQMVGDSGWQLSHGEKSRLYVARALLQKAELVVLDESFAALDPENLKQALECVLARARTLVVIAHP